MTGGGGQAALRLEPLGGSRGSDTKKLGSFPALHPLLKHLLTPAFMASGHNDNPSPLPGLLPYTLHTQAK